MKLSLAVPAYKAVDIDDVSDVFQRIVRVMVAPRVPKPSKPPMTMDEFFACMGRPSIMRHHRHCRLTRARVRDLYDSMLPAPWEG